MKVVTAEEMQEIDRKTIEDYGVQSIVLMENAGIQVVRVLLERHKDISEKRIGIFAGKGNNGGDGMVIARHLVTKGIDTTLFLLARKEAVSGDANTNLKIVTEMGIRTLEIDSLEDFELHKKEILHCDIFVDAILGTGLNSPVKGYYKDIISFLNNAGKFTLSVDIPSGLSSDAGEIIGEHIKADITVTFGFPKRGHLLYPGAKYVGRLEVVDISIPGRLSNKVKVNLIEEEDIRAIFHPRDPDSHKGNYGHILVVAGSIGKGGAAALASISALKIGAGLVTLALPESMNLAVEVGIPEVMTLPLPQTNKGTIDLSAKDKILDSLEGKDVLLIGPGISTHPRTVKLLGELLMAVNCPVVIDADGINGLKTYLDLLKNISTPMIMTPHPGEMARLLDITVKDLRAKRLELTQNLAEKYNIYIALKGARSVIAEPGGEIYLNPTGNPGMATAGAGDVLSGIIAGLISQRFSLSNALKSAVYLHGLAGDIASMHLGQMSLIAGDIIDSIPEAVREVIGSKE
ncbi:MAG: NAD(P)H-hydrate dehydratase [Nitrospinota bacterium]